MPTPDDMKNMKRESDALERDAKILQGKQKELLRQQITNLDREIANLNKLKSKAASELSSMPSQ